MLFQPGTRRFWFSALFLGKLFPKPKLCTKFEVASFSGCKNKQGVPILLDASLAQPPTNFGPKRCFLVLPKLKLHTKFEVASFNGCINK